MSPVMLESKKLGNKHANALRELDEHQLVLTLRESSTHLFHLRMQSAADRLETPSDINKVKKQIARIKTIQRERRGSSGRNPRIKRGELMDASITEKVLSWIEANRDRWTSRYLPLRKVLMLARDDQAVAEVHPEEVALALEDLVQQGKMSRRFLLIRPSGETVAGKEYGSRKEVPLDEARKYSALVTPGYSLNPR